MGAENGRLSASVGLKSQGYDMTIKQFCRLPSTFHDEMIALQMFCDFKEGTYSDTASNEVSGVNT